MNSENVIIEASAVQRPAVTAWKVGHGWLSFLCGCVLGLIFMELALHKFVGKSENSSGSEVRTIREGIAVAHFAPDALRSTGNPQIAGAPSILVLGDSHVEAFQVSDKQTMGSVLERRLRSDRRAWNVLQYAFDGAVGPDYIYAAPLVLERYRPMRVFLIMNAGDFRTITIYTRLEEKNGEVTVAPLGPGIGRGRPASFGGPVVRKLKESAVFYSATLRLTLDILPKLRAGAVSAEQGGQGGGLASRELSIRSIELILRGLKEAYGDKLFILYTPEQMYSREDPPETQEAALLSECQEQGMTCRSLRKRMVEGLLDKHEIARGFTNTTPGFGHFNFHGHEMAAAELYDWQNSAP